MKNPKKLFERPIECCHIDSRNKQVLNFLITYIVLTNKGIILIMADFIQVLEQHMACAALEHPLNVHYDEKYFGSCLESVLISLKARGYLRFDLSSVPSSRIWHYIGPEVYM